MPHSRSLACIAPIAAVLLLVVATRSYGAGTTSADIFGRWLTDDGKGIVTVAQCGDTVCGRIIQVLDREPGVPAVDVNNPDPSLRKRAILGLPVLAGFRRDAGQWSGRAYDPKSGRSYRSQLALNPDGSLKVTGCVLFICRSKRWRRVP